MDQHFPLTSEESERACQQKYRRLGAVFLLIGVACTWATWYVGPKSNILYGGRMVMVTLVGPILFLLGLANAISPPKTELAALANKRREGVLAFVGLAVGAVELYFYNDIYGIW